jgi:uncharacterized membrane protein YqjE
MLHPLLTSLIKRPDLIVEHVSAYAALFHDEAVDVVKDLVIRAAAWVIALLSSVIFLILTGVAVIVGFTNEHFHWALIAVPAVALLIAIIAVVRAIKPWQTERFSELKAQVESDAEALRAVA